MPKWIYSHTELRSFKPSVKVYSHQASASSVKNSVLHHVDTLHWTQMADDSNGHIGLDLNGHLGWSQMANGGLLRPVMSPGLKIPPWSTH